MQKIPSQPAPLVPKEGYQGSIGHTAEEFKPDKNQALPAEIAPLASRALQELIGSTRANDQIRLNVPKSSNPFLNTPNGQKHDYLLLRSVLSRSQSVISQEMIHRLQEGESTISPQAANFMKASLGREHKMLDLIAEMTESMGRVHIRMVSSQEG